MTVVADNFETVVAEATKQHHRDVRGCFFSRGNDRVRPPMGGDALPLLDPTPTMQACVVRSSTDRGCTVECGSGRECVERVVRSLVLAVAAQLSAVAVGNAWNAWCYRLYWQWLHS